MLAAAAAAAGNGDGTAAGEGTENADPQQALGEGGKAGLELIEPANFFKEFDAWVDGKYPGDRGSATKVKVAFRKVRQLSLGCKGEVLVETFWWREVATISIVRFLWQKRSCGWCNLSFSFFTLR